MAATAAQHKPHVKRCFKLLRIYIYKNQFNELEIGSHQSVAAIHMKKSITNLAKRIINQKEM